jgi:hypothetical protein
MSEEASCQAASAQAEILQEGNGVLPASEQDSAPPSSADGLFLRIPERKPGFSSCPETQSQATSQRPESHAISGAPAMCRLSTLLFLQSLQAS